MDANRSDLDKFRNKITEAVQKFRSENEKYGYGSRQVNEFLDDLIIMANYYGADNSPKGSSNEAVMREYIRLAEDIISEIKSVKFTQGVRGYDTQLVDEYLDDLINHINKNVGGDGGKVDPDVIKNTKFKVGFRGYDTREVDRLMHKLGAAVEGLNNIKGKYM